MSTYATTLKTTTGMANFNATNGYLVAKGLEFPDGSAITAPSLIIATTTLLSPLQSGATLLPSAASPQTFTLPAPSLSTGVKYTFVAGSTQAHVIACSTPVLSYAILTDAGTASFGDTRNIAGTSITLSTASSNIGDVLNIVCNGTNWFVTGVLATAPTIV